MIFSKRTSEYTSAIFRHIFYDLPDFDIKFRAKSGVYATAVNYLVEHPDLTLLRNVWKCRFLLDESPEKAIIYFLGGINGLEEDIFSLKNYIKDEKYLKILSEVIQSLEEEKITHELEKLIWEMEEDTTAWNLLLLCLREFSCD